MARDLTRVTEEEEERLGKAGGSTVWPPKWGGLTSTHPAGTPQVEPWARTTLHPTPPPTPWLVATPCSRRNAMLPCKDAHGIWMPRSQKGEGGRRAGRWSQHKPGQRRGGGPISGRGSGFWFQLPPLDLVFLPPSLFLSLVICCCCLVFQSCPTLCYPMDYSPPGSSVHGIFQARTLEWVAVPSSRGSSRPGDQTPVSCIGRQIL